MYTVDKHASSALECQGGVRSQKDEECIRYPGIEYECNVALTPSRVSENKKKLLYVAHQIN